MQSEQPRGLVWWLRSHPRVWATVIPLVTLVLAALATSQFVPPTLPRNLRNAFEAADHQANSRHLYAAESVAVKADLRRLAAAAQEKSIDYEQCEAAIRQVRIVMMEVAISRGLAQSYFTTSSISDEEKVAGGNVLRRYARAVCEEKVDEETTLEIDRRVTRLDGEGNRHFRETLSDEELRDLLTAMDAVAEEAGIPETVVPIDVKQRVRHIVDQTLANPVD